MARMAEGCKSAECRYKTCALSPQDEYSCTATQYRDCSNESREKILTCANGMVFDGVGGSCSYKAKCESEPRRRKG
uniref:Chitin-binding type-2 domain-containing protein n=1 Tax=Romanomermis culicivorax TaxID=13658 RepID=A0A915KIF3_ROMCU